MRPNNLCVNCRKVLTMKYYIAYPNRMYYRCGCEINFTQTLADNVFGDGNGVVSAGGHRDRCYFYA